MANKRESDGSAPAAPDPRKDRLAEQLRANLRKRKDQARARQALTGDGADSAKGDKTGGD